MNFCLLFFHLKVTKSPKNMSGYCLFLVLLEFDGERGIKLELMIITIFIFS